MNLDIFDKIVKKNNSANYLNLKRKVRNENRLNIYGYLQLNDGNYSDNPGIDDSCRRIRK